MVKSIATHSLKPRIFSTYSSLEKKISIDDFNKDAIITHLMDFINSLKENSIENRQKEYIRNEIGKMQEILFNLQIYTAECLLEQLIGGYPIKLVAVFYNRGEDLIEKFWSDENKINALKEEFINEIGNSIDVKNESIRKLQESGIISKEKTGNYTESENNSIEQKKKEIIKAVLKTV